jgi:hypothetical protein
LPPAWSRTFPKQLKPPLLALVDAFRHITMKCFQVTSVGATITTNLFDCYKLRVYTNIFVLTYEIFRVTIGFTESQEDLWVRSLFTPNQSPKTKQLNL